MARVYRPKRKAPAYRRKRTYGSRLASRRRRYRSRIPSTLSLTRAGTGLPANLYMKHHYRTPNINLTNTTTGTADYTFMVNSMYDPDVSGGGYQPTLRDNLYSLYKYSRVVAAKVTVTFMNTGGQHSRCGVVYTEDSTDAPFAAAVSNDNRAITKDRAKFSSVTEYQGSRTQTKVVKYFNFKHHQKDLYSSVNFRAESTANPVKALYCIIGAQCLAGSDLQMRAEVLIELTVRWEGPLNPEMSTLD